MKGYVIAVIAWMLWEVTAKFCWLAIGQTHYSAAATAVDGLIAVWFALWGVWVLASA